MSFEELGFGKLGNEDNGKNVLIDNTDYGKNVRIDEDEKELTLFQEKIKFVLSTGKSVLSDEDRKYLTELYDNSNEGEE